MTTYLTDREKASHPYYIIMTLEEKDLLKELNSWTRLELIDWLAWNDSNGIYRDKISLAEFGEILSKEEAIKIMARQILEA